MKEMTVGKLKAEFSSVLDNVLEGEEYTVLRGKNKQKVAMIVPYSHKGKKKPHAAKEKRILGRDKGRIEIKPDFDELPEDILKSFGVM